MVRALASAPRRNRRQIPGEDDRDGGGSVERAVRLELVDLRRQERLAVGEQERGRERGHRQHEHEERRAHQGRPKEGEHDASEGGPAPCSQVRRGVQERGVEPAQGRADEEVEVDVEHVDVDRQDGADAAERERHAVQPERRLQPARQHPRLAVQKQEREHADEGRQRQRQRGDGPQRLAQREVVAPQRPRQRRPRNAAQRHRPQRHADGVHERARPGGPPLAEQLRQQGAVEAQAERFERRPQDVADQHERDGDGERPGGAAAQHPRWRRASAGGASAGPRSRSARASAVGSTTRAARRSAATNPSRTAWSIQAASGA